MTPRELPEEVSGTMGAIRLRNPGFPTREQSHPSSLQLEPPMKKYFFLTAALLAAPFSGCGEGALLTDDTPDLVETQTGEIVLQGCTALTASSVRAIGDDGNVPGSTLDDNLGTRWSHFGKGSWIQYDLGSAKSLAGAAVAWHRGNERSSSFSLSTSSDGSSFTPAFTGRSSGTATAAETYRFTARTARYLRITVDGNTLNEWASIAEARVCAGTSASGIVWRGDFEPGNISQWTRAQQVSADRLQIVTSPVRQGRYALKATVRQGDDPINSSGNRNELVYMSREPVGSEFYYRWGTRFAADFPSARTWQLFTQWHHEGSGGSPPVEFYVYGEEIRLNIGGSPGTIVWRTPLVRDRWNDFVFHVKWSADPKVGFVELYYQGQLVLPRRHIATMFPGQLNYLKVGLYRNETVQPTGVVYHDGWVQARTLEDALAASAEADVQAQSLEP
jgi:hypothetical protein